MAVTERTRHELHETLVGLMGPEMAETMMESLPPVGWGDIATTRYIDDRVAGLDERMGGLETRFDERMSALETRLDERMSGLEERMTLRMESLEHRLLGAMDAKLRQTNITMMAMMTSQTAVLVTLVLALR